MEGNGLPGGIFSGATGLGSGMLGLDMPVNQTQQQQNPPNPHNHVSHHNQHQMVAFPHQDGELQPHSLKQAYPFAPKAKQLASISDEDEPGLAPEDSGDAKRKASPWQRMKWTDNMVRLLIMAVYCIGDEVGVTEGNDPSGKKKPGGLLQKKGKWKSVSKAMMEKGFYVSPQQCEDKFNDLNKRYKRVNDIIGKGTACKVVENQSLLDKMDHISPKMKEEVRKLLNSKHLFFREMCAYHNSCNGGAGGSSGTAGIVASHLSAETLPEPSLRCLHSPESGSGGVNLGRTETEGSKMLKGGSEPDEEDYGDDDEVDEDDEDDDDDDEVVTRGRNLHGCEDGNANDGRHLIKRPRNEMMAFPSPLAQQFRSEMATLLQDGTRSLWEKRQWIKTRLLQLEERELSYQCVAFELEKQRLKWLKYCGKKEREMEQSRLKNERMKLENERMILLLRHRELELLDPNQQQRLNNRKADPCCPPS